MKPFVKFLFAALLPLALAGPAAAQLTYESSREGQVRMMSAAGDAGQVASIRKVPSVGVIRLNMRVVPGMADDISVSSMRMSAQKNASGIARLRAALARNPVTRAALDAHGIKISRVVGVTISSNGSLRVYIL